MSYNPNQPRDPAGSDTGGQWTSDQMNIIENAARLGAGLAGKGISAEEMKGTARFLFRKEKSGKVFVSANGATGMGSAEGLIIKSPFPQAAFDIPEKIKIYIENRVRNELMPAMASLEKLKDFDLDDEDEMLSQVVKTVKSIREDIRLKVEQMVNE